MPQPFQIPSFVVKDNIALLLANLRSHHSMRLTEPRPNWHYTGHISSNTIVGFWQLSIHRSSLIYGVTLVGQVWYHREIMETQYGRCLETKFSTVSKITIVPGQGSGYMFMYGEPQEGGIINGTRSISSKIKMQKGRGFPSLMSGQQHANAQLD